MRSLRIKPVLALVSGLVAVAATGCSTGFIESPPTNVTPTGATLIGKVGSDRSESGAWWFEYGTSTAYGKSTPQRTITFAKNVKQPVSEPVTGLSGATEYHYRLCAKDQDPQTGAHCSGDAKFTTAGTDRPRYQLHIDAADGSTSDPQSGVAELAIKVDDEQVDATKPGCGGQNCTLSRDWTLNTTNYSPGPHTVTVTATDAVGRTTSRKLNIEIQRDTTDPGLTVSGPLKAAPEGWVDQHDYTVTGKATDSGYGATSMKLLVDDNQVGQAATQNCPDGGCSLDHTFTVNTANYSGGAHDVKLVATDGAGNDTTSSWTVNVNPDGQIPASEASATLKAADDTSGSTTVAPTSQVVDPAEIADGNNPGLQLSGSGLTSTGTPATSTMTTDPADGFTIQAPDDSIHVTPVAVGGNATDSSVTAGVAAVAANTSNEVDAVVRPIFDGVMTFENIRDPGSPETYAWRVQLDSDQTLKSVDSQNAAVYYTDGTAALLIHAGAAHDATGAAVPSSLTVSNGNVITLTVSHHGGGFRYPIAAGPGWEAGYTAPVLPPSANPPTNTEAVQATAGITVDAPEAAPGDPDPFGDVLSRALPTRHRRFDTWQCSVLGCSVWNQHIKGFFNYNGNYAWWKNSQEPPSCPNGATFQVSISLERCGWVGVNHQKYGHGYHISAQMQFVVTASIPPWGISKTDHKETTVHMYGDGYWSYHMNACVCNPTPY